MFRKKYVFQAKETLILAAASGRSGLFILSISRSKISFTVFAAAVISIVDAIAQNKTKWAAKLRFLERVLKR